jgi:hypothetical protein
MTVVRRPPFSQAGNGISFTFPANCGKSCRQALVNQSGIKLKRTVPSRRILLPAASNSGALTAIRSGPVVHDTTVASTRALISECITSRSCASKSAPPACNMRLSISSGLVSQMFKR